MEWKKYPEEVPPVKEDFYAFTHSEDVLFSDGNKIYIGYLQVWEDDSFPHQWKVRGPDGYCREGVTHWSFLPEPPKEEQK